MTESNKDQPTGSLNHTEIPQDQHDVLGTIEQFTEHQLIEAFAAILEAREAIANATTSKELEDAKEKLKAAHRELDTIVHKEKSSDNDLLLTGLGQE